MGPGFLFCSTLFLCTLQFSISLANHCEHISTKESNLIDVLMVIKSGNSTYGNITSGIIHRTDYESIVIEGLEAVTLVGADDGSTNTCLMCSEEKHNASQKPFQVLFYNVSRLNIMGIKFENCYGKLLIDSSINYYDSQFNYSMAVFIFDSCAFVNITDVYVINYYGYFFMFINPLMQVFVQNANIIKSSPQFVTEWPYGGGIYFRFYDSSHFNMNSSVLVELQNITINGSNHAQEHCWQWHHDENETLKEHMMKDYWQAQGLTIILSQNDSSVNITLSLSIISNNSGCNCSGILYDLHSNSSINSHFQIINSTLSNNNIDSESVSTGSSLLVFVSIHDSTNTKQYSPINTGSRGHGRSRNCVDYDDVSKLTIILSIRDTVVTDHTRTPIRILSLAADNKGLEKIELKRVKFINNTAKDQAVCLNAVSEYNSQYDYPNIIVSFEDVEAFKNNQSQVLLGNVRKMAIPPISSSLFLFVNLLSVTIQNHDDHESGKISYHSNKATIFSGISTDFSLSGSISFFNNSANLGTCFQLHSFTHIFLDQSAGVNITFSSNHAYTVGGAIASFSDGNSYSMCFLQVDDNQYDKYRITFDNNTAAFAGNDIYGDLIYHCFINKIFSKHKFYENTFHPYNESNIVARPFSVVIENNTLAVYPGQQVPLKLKVVDINGNTVPSYVYSSVRSVNDNFTLNQTTFFYSPDDHDRPDHDPAKYKEFSITVMYHEVSYIVTSIPVYFSTPYLPAQGNNDITFEINPCPAYLTLNSHGKCVCRSFLMSHQILMADKCDINGVTEVSNAWFKCTGNETIDCIYTPWCTGGYCKTNFSFSGGTPTTGLDLCTGNRQGNVCGSCKQNYSVVFGTVECRICDNRKALPLILSLWLMAGIAAVTITYTLKLTLDQGTVGGLFFYVHVSYLSLNLTADQKNFFVFISHWFIRLFNFTLSTPVCFFDNMTNTQKHFLYFASPLYVCLIVVFIIIASRYSVKISNYTSHLSVQVLVTLMHLMFAQFLLLVIGGFAYIRLRHDVMTGTTLANYAEYVWYFSGEVKYGKGLHLAILIISSIVALFLLLPYLVLSTLAPFLYFHSWINRFQPVYDTMFAPYKENCRHWFGYRLMVLSFITIIYALAVGYHKVWEMHVNMTVLIVYTLALAVRQPFKTTALNYLEIWLTGNVTLCQILEQHKTNVTVYHCKSAFMFMAFLTACFIGGYHTLKMLTAIPIIKKIVEKCQKSRQRINLSLPVDQRSSAPVGDFETSSDSTFINYGSIGVHSNSQLRESLLSNAS